MTARFFAAATPVLLALCAFAARAGPPFLTDDPEPVETGHWEIYAFSSGAFGEADASGVGPAVEVNYGAAPNLQLHLIANMAWDAPAGAPARSGVGDTELGVKYRLLEPPPNSLAPEVGVFPLLELPTGEPRRGLGAGEAQAFLPVWLQWRFGRWTSYGGGGYWLNPGPGNRNYWFAGWQVQRQLTRRLALGAEVFHETPSQTGRAGVTGFSLGGQYDLTSHYHLLLSVGRGGLNYAVDGAADRYPTTYYAGVQYTF